MHNTTKSPLELLEQRSKRLASKASNPAPAPSNRVPSTSNPSFERQVSRKSSTSSIGSILGAFRLSSLSVFDKEYSTPQSQRVPNTAASRPESLYDTESIIDAPVSLSSPSVGVTSSTGASPPTSRVTASTGITPSTGVFTSIPTSPRISHGISPSVSSTSLSTSNLDSRRASTHRRTSSSNTTPLPPLDPLDDFKRLKAKALNHNLTLDERVTLGVYYHENGNLRESSYHWQHASFAGDVTAMLLYGLALRHGWGIRKMPQDAVKWLRKAVGPILQGDPTTQVSPGTGEEDEDLDDIDWLGIGDVILDPKARAKFIERVDQFIGSSSHVNSSEAGKIKKAQVALAIYELGMCYLNAWGIEKDEDLALRCFELSGSLGDSDALSEAGRLWTKNGPKIHHRSSGHNFNYSYISGQSNSQQRKKDFQRAALLYRMAEEHGAANVSNSWIYKDKYMMYTDVQAEDKKKKKK